MSQPTFSKQTPQTTSRMQLVALCIAIFSDFGLYDIYV